MSMWTKFRDAVVGYAAPIVGGIAGGIVGGPAGAAIGTRLGQGLIGGGGQAPSVSAPGMPRAAMPGSGGMMQTAGVIPPAMRALSAAGRYLISARGIASTLTGRIIGVFKGSRLFRVRQVADLAKRVGIDAAAAALGVTAVEVAQMIAAHLTQSAGKRSRGRGISARDVRTTRRTITKIRSIEHSLSGVCRPRASSRARKAAPAAFIRQG